MNVNKVTKVSATTNTVKALKIKNIGAEILMPVKFDATVKTDSTKKFISSYRCRFWDIQTSKWATTGVTTIKSKDSISCKTTHFTDFAGFEILTEDQN